MIAWIYISAVAMFYGGSSGSMYFSPQTLSEYGFGESNPPPCREVTPFEERTYSETNLGKRATFASGNFICEKNIFRYGERDSFFDFAVKNAPLKAKQSASAFKAVMLANQNLGESIPWQIVVKSPDAELRYYLQAVFIHEFVDAVGSGMISRRATDEEAPKIHIEVFTVDDPQVFLKISALSKAERWLL